MKRNDGASFVYKYGTALPQSAANQIHPLQENEDPREPHAEPSRAMEDDDSTPEVTSVPINGQTQGRSERHLSAGAMNLALQDDQWTFESPVSPQPGQPLVVHPGTYRYLKGAELEGVTYDFAVVTRRKANQQKNTKKKKEKGDVVVDISAGVEGRLIEKLVASGLDVDVLEGISAAWRPTARRPASTLCC